MHRGSSEIAQSLHVEYDDPAQCGAAVADAQHFVELFLILDERQRGRRCRAEYAPTPIGVFARDAMATLAAPQPRIARSA